MIEFFLIGLVLLVGYFFSNALKAREIALHAARMHCKRLELQMLDDYVALTGYWGKRDSQGQLIAWRSYTFEFSSTGYERYHGKIIMLGFKISSIELEPYRES